MALFRLENDVATQVLPLPSHPAKEKALQRLVEANLEPLFGVRFVASEFATGQKHRGRIDTLGLDQDGSPVIIEYKLTSHDNVINQGLFYLDWLMDHRGDFEIAARTRVRGGDFGPSRDDGGFNRVAKRGARRVAVREQVGPSGVGRAWASESG